MSDPLLNKIRSRGYWRVIARPTRFSERLIPDLALLYPLLRKSTVSMRGWDFPHLDPHREPTRYADSIGQNFQWDRFLEVWRFYQSGQFIDISGIIPDWIDQSELTARPKDWEPGLFLSIQGTTFRFTEIFEFAARLSLSDAFSSTQGIFVQVQLYGLNGRSLYFEGSAGALEPTQYIARIPEFKTSITTSRSELVAAPREPALRASRELFQRFQWDPSVEMLRDIQGELYARREYTKPKGDGL